MTDKQLLIILAVFFLIRYNIDGICFALGVRVKEHFTKQIEEEEQVADTHNSREWRDDYSDRLARIKSELDEYNKSPNNAHTSDGTYNIPHDEINVPIDLEPAIEYEHEYGRQEVAD